MYENLKRILCPALLSLLLFCAAGSTITQAQSAQAPLSNQELVRFLYQLPKHPEKRDELVEEIRRRGIGFPLTEGLRSLVATKSGNDALLRRTLEEAERRRQNPTNSTLPSEAEWRDILEKTRAATMAAAEAMPDFIVRQQIIRSYSRGGINNWLPLDRLTVAVSYRAGVGEEYKLLAINGLPANTDEREKPSYEQAGGTSSTGEYVSMLAALFAPETHAEFKISDTDLLRGRRTVVFDYEVKKEFSRHTIKASGVSSVITGYRGRIWVDRESYRVLRIENQAIEIPLDFPVTEAFSLIDYDWVNINERPYLLPSRAEIKLTGRSGDQLYYTRNEIRFRSYQKFGTEVKIIDDIEPEDETENKP